MKRSACFMVVFDYRDVIRLQRCDYRDVISRKVITRAQAFAAGTSNKIRWFFFSSATK